MCTKTIPSDCCHFQGTIRRLSLVCTLTSYFLDFRSLIITELVINHRAILNTSEQNEKAFFDQQMVICARGLLLGSVYEHTYGMSFDDP